MQRHYFIAVSLPDEVKRVIWKAAQQISDMYHFEKWVHQEDYHITLAFLGPSDQEKWMNCMKDIEAVIHMIKAFPIKISHFDIFGKGERPRIFWCGLEKEERFFSLQKEIAQICKKYHYRIDEKPFRPHITVARKYKHSDGFNENDLLTCNTFMKERQTFMVNKISLYESQIEKTPKYLALRSIYLKE